MDFPVARSERIRIPANIKWGRYKDTVSLSTVLEMQQLPGSYESTYAFSPVFVDPCFVWYCTGPTVGSKAFLHYFLDDKYILMWNGLAWTTTMTVHYNTGAMALGPSSSRENIIEPNANLRADLHPQLQSMGKSGADDRYWLACDKCLPSTHPPPCPHPHPWQWPCSALM